MAERRDEFRLSASGTAKIVGTGGETPIHCTVHDISGSGCSLAVNAMVRLPESFQLVPDDDNSLGYPCRMVWRKGGRIGIKFDE
jgi:hypothetical protein